MFLSNINLQTSVYAASLHVCVCSKAMPSQRQAVLPMMLLIMVVTLLLNISILKAKALLPLAAVLT